MSLGAFVRDTVSGVGAASFGASLGGVASNYYLGFSATDGGGLGCYFSAGSGIYVQQTNMTDDSLDSIGVVSASEIYANRVFGGSVWYGQGSNVWTHEAHAGNFDLIAASPNVPGAVYIADTSNNQIKKSTDRGQTWANVGNLNAVATNLNIRHIFVRTDTDIWVTSDVRSTQGKNVYHWNGIAWGGNTIGPSTTNLVAGWADGDWFFGSGNAYFCGFQNNGGGNLTALVYMLTNAPLAIELANGGSANNKQFLSIWGDTQNVFAGGNYGLLMTGQTGVGGVDSWTQVTLPAGLDVTSDGAQFAAVFTDGATVLAIGQDNVSDFHPLVIRALYSAAPPPAPPPFSGGAGSPGNGNPGGVTGPPGSLVDAGPPSLIDDCPPFMCRPPVLVYERMKGFAPLPPGTLPLVFRNMKEKCAFLVGIINVFARDPRIRHHAFTVFQQYNVPPRNLRAQIEALTAHFQQYYYLPENVETFASPLFTIQHGYGDCDDTMSALGACLQSIGIRVAPEILGKRDARGKVQWRHIYLRAFDGKEWVSCETTRELPPGADPAWYVIAADSLRQEWKGE